MLAVMFLGLSLIVHANPVWPVDRSITLTIQSMRHPLLDALALGLTFLGNGLPLTIFAISAATIFFVWRWRWAALLTLITLLGLPVNMLLKEIVGRPRPAETMVDVLLPAIGLSFPSGHAMVPTMFYGFLALMCWVHFPDRRQRAAWTVFFAAIGLMVGLSRVYLGVHWFSDVVGGWTAGLFFLLILAEVYRLVANFELKPPPGAAQPQRTRPSSAEP